jgi:hypothetical protein
VSAAVALLDRGWGKPPQAITGEDGGELRITIRQLVEHASNNQNPSELESESEQRFATQPWTQSG